MIIIGTFFRGPGWNLFWPWQRWDPHKVVALTNVDLPYLIGFRNYFWSALFGLVCVAAYFVLAIGLFYAWVIRTKGKEFMQRWGPVRFVLTAFLFVTMAALPLKMFLRLAFNVKYILVTPWLNI
jgi:low temperature requirement protein LtrA